MSGAETISVLFVCLGNICRSPSAHGVFRARAASAGWGERIVVDSAGTGDWHIGKPPDARAMAAAMARGFDIADLRARQVGMQDLHDFDYVLAMDQANLDTLEAMAERSPGGRARVALFGDYSRHYRGQPVPDPYFGGDGGFQKVLDMIEDATDGLLREIARRLQAG